MFHLTAQVAWHDNRWNGTVCRNPSCNSFCTTIADIRARKRVEIEERNSGKSWSKIPSHPPCDSKCGAFMNKEEWQRSLRHSEAKREKTKSTHGHLVETSVKVPPYSTFVVPYKWLHRNSQEEVDKKSPHQLPPDDNLPNGFTTPWIFGRERQRAVLELFSSNLKQEKSLVFFYCKDGHPLGDDFQQPLIVGAGTIAKIHPINYYKAKAGSDKPDYPMWDLLIQHSIRPDGEEGFLLPYHDYLEQTGNSIEDARRRELLKEIAVTVDPSHSGAFSWTAELARPDTALSTLVRLLAAVRKIREHGIASGPWEQREEWLNAQIASAWQERGAYPGLGAALEALGMRLGTAFTLHLQASGELAGNDPWQSVGAILQGKQKSPLEFAGDIRATKDNWINLSSERRDLLKLLSRFAFTPQQAKRWFDKMARDKGTHRQASDREILENPYLMSELDLGGKDDDPVSIALVDRGLLPDATIAAKYPVPEPSRINSPNDARRLRAVLVAVLRQAAENGDALLSVPEAIEHANSLELARPCNLGTDWPETNKDALSGTIELMDISGTAALQLVEIQKHEKFLSNVLSKRAAKELTPLEINWTSLLRKTITAFDANNVLHVRAIEEQSEALKRLVSHRLSVLVGKAGTGKTSVLGALQSAAEIKKDGILFLAPTGKARVRIRETTGTDAMTIAQFLYKLGRYDGNLQKVKFEGEPYRKEKTVVIDECSMLTMDTLVAVLKALDLAHVQRLIMVGDPNQLPPIGVGRPFADLVSYLEEADKGSSLKHALARLTVEVRTAKDSGASDALRLASWFTGELQPVDADRIRSDLDLGEKFNDLEIVFWKSPEELHAQLLHVFQKHLGIKSESDILGFDASLGINNRGFVPRDNPDGSENWQILSPVRMHAYGVHEINRWIQHRFRSKDLLQHFHLGDERIVIKDKVMQRTNGQRDSYDWASQRVSKSYLANGEVGLASNANQTRTYMNFFFAGRPNLSFGYSRKDFSSGRVPLELAYALTVHKSQGSEFKKVFVIIPKSCRILSRELVYTALTRSREQLVLLIEGDNASALFDLSRPEKSDTARRNTNLFRGAVRATMDEQMPFAEHLIHRTSKGVAVRSKSELVIANMLEQLGINYEYERTCEGENEPGRLLPDFSFITASGDLIIWEHLGMLDRPDYRRGWEWKRAWYESNGFIEGQNLFTSMESPTSGLDTRKLEETAKAIQALLDE